MGTTVADYKITLYSGGVAVAVFHAESCPASINGAGIAFKDKGTGKLISLSGTFVVERE